MKMAIHDAAVSWGEVIQGTQYLSSGSSIWLQWDDLIITEHSMVSGAAQRIMAGKESYRRMSLQRYGVDRPKEMILKCCGTLGCKPLD